MATRHHARHDGKGPAHRDHVKPHGHVTVPTALPELPPEGAPVHAPSAAPSSATALPHRKWYAWLFRPESEKRMEKIEKAMAKEAAASAPSKMKAEKAGDKRPDAPKRDHHRRRLQRKSLQEYLDKAGYRLDAATLKRNLFRGVVGAFLVATIIILFLAGRNGATATDTLIFILGLWTAVFAFALLVAIGAVFFFLDYRIYKRTRELEEVLPDFLQLASSNIAAGMPIDRALWYAIRPSFGVLATEMEEVAKATMSGEDLEHSLMHFADRYESTTLKRSMSILIEGLRAGGEMADLLNKIALNIDEIKIMRKEMAANVTTYAIFITFASIIIAPFLFALATELLTIIVKITSTLDLSSTSSMFSMGTADPGMVADFKLFSILMLIVSTGFSASIVSVIKNGNIMDGIKSIPVYALVAVIIYYVSLSVLDGVFGGII